MELKKQFRIIYTGIILLLAILGLLTILMFQSYNKFDKSSRAKYDSFRIADELRQTSDDLTRFCRIYVLTGDSIWEKKYWEIIDIRNGVKPRSDGRTIALRDSMVNLGFSNREFDKLNEAEDNSNKLVWTETLAFNAMKGLFDDGTGQFTVKGAPNIAYARRIMFDDKYYADKAKIMTPIGDFIELLDIRTSNVVAIHRNNSNWLLGSIIGLIILISSISIISYFQIKNKIIKQLEKLKLANKKIVIHEDILKKQNESLDELVDERTKELMVALDLVKKGEKVKDVFIANMSHEIRTPLNTILGFTELIKERTSSLIGEEEKKFFEVVSHSGQRLMNTVHEILDISQIEAGTYVGKKVEFNLVDLVQSQVAGMKMAAEEKKLRIEFQSTLKNMQVFADRDGITQSISNILDNAIKYTIKGKITVSLTQKSKCPILTIEDTGVGMSKKYQDKIFEIFSQESEGYSKNYQGIGLGMSIVKRHLDLNQVKIVIKSTRGKGTAIILTFPRLEQGDGE